jgi:predicted ATP-dependent protease
LVLAYCRASRPADLTLPEFIHLIASEANEISAKENKKTIQPEHVLKALHVCYLRKERTDLVLQELGFRQFVDQVNETYQKHKTDQAVGGYLYYFPRCSPALS